MSNLSFPPATDWAACSDQYLLQAIGLKYAGALGALYDRYGRLVYSLAYNVVEDDGLAEEITQDVFLQVWNKALTYQPERGKVNTWLTGVARHRAIDTFRRRSSRPEGYQVSWDDDATPDVPADIQVEPAVELELDVQQLHSALVELPKEQQTALALAFFKGYSHQEVAEALGEPLGTIKTRIRLAMKKLRQALESTGDGTEQI